MPDGKPLWRAAFDKVERSVAPHLERGVQTGAFAEALALVAKGRAEVRRLTERRTRQVWHLMNLPAGSDVRRLRQDVLHLERQVSELLDALEETRRPRKEVRRGSR